MKLSPVQKEIVETSGNLMVRASAGTGKTFTMVNKIAKEIDDNHTHKVIAAITFTIKAAQEIKDRLSVDISQHFIGTNNSFVIEEVIKPFMKDVYGADFDLDMSTDYSVKVNTFQEGIEKVRNEGILCSYKDNKNNFIIKSSENEKLNANVVIIKHNKMIQIRFDGFKNLTLNTYNTLFVLPDEFKPVSGAFYDCSNPNGEIYRIVISSNGVVELFPYTNINLYNACNTFVYISN